MLRKLDYLLDKFLQFASKEAQFRTYLNGLLSDVRGLNAEDGSNSSGYEPPRRKTQNGNGRSFSDVSTSQSMNAGEMVAEIQTSYNKDMDAIRSSMEQEQDSDTTAILQKRLDIVQKRLEFAGKTGKILSNLDHQLQLVEDTFGLINDEIRARTPEQLLSDIEEVVVASNSMTSALEELVPFEHISERIE